MKNEIYLITKGKGSLEGKTFIDIEGFDYEDKETALTLNVRKGMTEIRFCGYLIDIAVLNKVAIEQGRK